MRSVGRSTGRATIPQRVTVPAVTLDALVTDVKTKLNARGGMRIVGNPQTRVQKNRCVAGHRADSGAPSHSCPQVDVIIAGEIREWESSEYVRDTVTAGLDKGLILIGRTLLRGPRHEGVRRMAADDRARRAVPLDAARRSVLEADGMTAGDVVDRIKKNLGVAWRDTTYRDTFKAGGPETPVTGIATTVFASFDMIQRAVAAGLNMIIPHEVTFWNDRDDISGVSADPLYKQKADFLARHHVVIFRMHDHMHAQRPDFTYVGSARSLGLECEIRDGSGIASLHAAKNDAGRAGGRGARSVWALEHCASSAIRMPRSAASSSASATRHRP